MFSFLSISRDVLSPKILALSYSTTTSPTNDQMRKVPTILLCPCARDATTVDEYMSRLSEPSESPS